MKQFLQVCRFLCALTVMTVLSASACSDDDDKDKQPKEAWECESFMIEAYTSDGGNPYLDKNGVDQSNYPLGVVITPDKMIAGENEKKISFGNDGIIYHLANRETESEFWQKYGTYKIEGNQLIVEDGYFGTFFPGGQECPAQFGASEVTHEILEWTDTRRSIRQTQLDGNTGTRIICTTNFRRSEAV